MLTRNKLCDPLSAFRRHKTDEIQIGACVTGNSANHEEKVQRWYSQIRICRKLSKKLSDPNLPKSFGASNHMVLACAETFEQDRTAEFLEKLPTNLKTPLHFSLLFH